MGLGNCCLILPFQVTSTRLMLIPYETTCSMHAQETLSAVHLKAYDIRGLKRLEKNADVRLDKTEQVVLGKPQKAPFGPWSLLSTHHKRQIADVGRLGKKLEGLANTHGCLLYFFF